MKSVIKNMNLDSANFCVDEIVRDIVREVRSEKNDPFLTPYYFKFMERLRQFNEIIIVGAGYYGRNLYRILEQNDIHTVKCFADNAFERYKNGIYGNTVLALHDAVKQSRGACFVVTPRYYYIELIRQLIKLGVDADMIECFVVSDTGLEM